MHNENTTHYRANVYINGSLLTEESTCTVKRTDGGNTVKTVAKGFAGRSPGAPMTAITVKNAVPSADFEFNPGAFMGNTEAIEVSVFAAGKTLTCTGFITNNNFKECANSTSMRLAFTFEGGESKWTT